MTFGVFDWVYQALRGSGLLQSYQWLGGELRVALDGTQFFSSTTLHCEDCSTRQHRNGSITYFHSAILPVIVAPGQDQVIALVPEWISASRWDGETGL
ncbi:MAG: hypothetical protein HC769_37380 [Cyanobacteria bacterium CRU_2_1]|nr:hypothetical protein [Cyanobacteria bacterium CRU_2_1]